MLAGERDMGEEIARLEHVMAKREDEDEEKGGREGKGREGGWDAV